MAKERLKSPRARLFVALDLPEPVRDGIVAWQRAELTDEALRVMPPENLHMTLVFLGFIPEKAIPRAAEIVHETRTGAMQIELGREPRAKPRGRPGLFALEAVSEAAMALQADLESRLVAEHLYKPEKRPFWPHLTVARVKKERRGSRRPARVGKRPGPLPDALCQPFGAVRVTLYRSKTRPQGAEYTSLAQIELPEAGQRLGESEDG
jgi:RNA 2',3'-cyclic 3'-phosphodiesterase